MKEYKIKISIRRGIDDLLPEYAFQGGSQGDESTTNSVAVYKESGGWLIPVVVQGRNFNTTNQEEVDKEIAFRKLINSFYIDKLKASGDFGKEYTEEITMRLNPLPRFDNPNT